MKVIEQGVGSRRASSGAARTIRTRWRPGADLLVKAIEREGSCNLCSSVVLSTTVHGPDGGPGHHRLDAVELGADPILAVVIEADDAEALATGGAQQTARRADLMLCATQLQQLVAEFAWSADELTQTGFGAEGAAPCSSWRPSPATPGRSPEPTARGCGWRKKGGRPVFEVSSRRARRCSGPAGAAEVSPGPGARSALPV